MDITPSEKSSEMTEFLEATTGRTRAISRMQCIPGPFGCGMPIAPGEIETWDKLTYKEYTISGLCKSCQDSVFVDPDDDDELENEDSQENASNFSPLASYDDDIIPDPFSPLD
jgi:hypothetical protein